ncbi:MAG: class I SAM-dependent methyltransferase [Actinomycetes bacterium]
MTGSIDGSAKEPFGGPAPIRRRLGQDEARHASRGWWDAHADEYQAEHAFTLGSNDLVWGPESLSEADAGLLGDVTGLRVLEVGCGAGQGSRWVAEAGGLAVGVDLSLGQLRHAQALDAGRPPDRPRASWLCADASSLPFGSNGFDLAFAAYGALQFVAEPASVHREVARVLHPGGRWVFSVTHPVRWAFPDDPGPGGLTATKSYFDRTPYVEEQKGTATYVEVHRTVGDHVRELRSAGFVLDDLVEPEWRHGHDVVWGGWSPLRGRILPGTAIFVTRLVARPSPSGGAR